MASKKRSAQAQSVGETHSKRNRTESSTGVSKSDETLVLDQDSKSDAQAPVKAQDAEAKDAKSDAKPIWPKGPSVMMFMGFISEGPMSWPSLEPRRMARYEPMVRDSRPIYLEDGHKKMYRSYLKHSGLGSELRFNKRLLEHDPECQEGHFGLKMWQQRHPDWHPDNPVHWAAFIEVEVKQGCVHGIMMSVFKDILESKKDRPTAIQALLRIVRLSVRKSPEPIFGVLIKLDALDLLASAMGAETSKFDGTQSELADEIVAMASAKYD